jgi:hypothetical protein
MTLIHPGSVLSFIAGPRSTGSTEKPQDEENQPSNSSGLAVHRHERLHLLEIPHIPTVEEGSGSDPTSLLGIGCGIIDEKDLIRTNYDP